MGRDAQPLSICGESVCFDIGGYNLKPGAGGLACMVIEAGLPVRLELRFGYIEHSISGDALPPLDVLRSRRELSVSVGNPDAERRLVSADLLAGASDAGPALLLGIATLTGAAGVALGPDVATMFCNDNVLAAAVCDAARAAHDAVWRLPLWDGYDYLLEGNGCDPSNVADKPDAGAVIVALFL